MRTSARTFPWVVAMLASLQTGSAPAQQPADLSACQTERDQQAAIAACSRVIADHALAASIRAEALMRRGLIYSTLSARDLDSAVEIDARNNKIRKDRARHYRATGQIERAIADYNEAIRLDSNDAAAYHGRGDAWLIQQNRSAAIADYRKSIELKPVDSARAWDQCRVSASYTSSFFNCVLVADDERQPADIRAEARRRIGIAGDGAGR